MTSQGSAVVRLARAIDTGNLNLVRAAAAEVQRVPLREALRIVFLLAEQEPEHFEAAAIRWIGRLAREARRLELSDVVDAVSALASLPARGEGARRRLVALCRRLQLV